jgi:hypothetical protein
MTTDTWIFVGDAALSTLIVASSYFRIRAQRAQLGRKVLWAFISNVVIWSLFALTLCGGVIRYLFLATILGIFAPGIYWILNTPKTPHDDDAV